MTGEKTATQKVQNYCAVNGRFVSDSTRRPAVVFSGGRKSGGDWCGGEKGHKSLRRMSDDVQYNGTSASSWYRHIMLAA